MKVKLLLICFGLLFSLVCCELSLRAYNAYQSSLPQNQPGAWRYVWSEAGLQTAPNGSVIGIPDLTIRQQNILADEVDFDVTVKTNNLGLFDHRDYHLDDSARMRIAVVGDSFTQGIGAPPWVGLMAEELEAEYPVQIFNLGIMGTGFKNFELILEHFQEQLQFTHVLVIAIEDDFKRGHLYPIACKSEVWLCKEGAPPEVCIARNSWFKLSKPADPCNIEAAPTDRATVQKERFATNSWYKKLLRPMISSSNLLTFLNAKRQEYIGYLKSRDTDNLPERFAENMQHLKNIVNKYERDRVAFAAIPDRNETTRGCYLSNARKYAKQEVGHYADLWEHCPITIDMFHKYDHHFHADGYAKIADCLKANLLVPMIEAELQG